VSLKLKGKFYRTTIQQLSVAEMHMLRWICDITRRDRIRNDDICKRLGVTPVEEKFVQHRLKWFGHIQRRPAEAPVHSGVINRIDNERRGRGRSNLTWEESVKRDLKDWSIIKKLALDRIEWKLAIHVSGPYLQFLLLFCLFVRVHSSFY
jgi:hypothetical protein